MPTDDRATGHLSEPKLISIAALISTVLEE